MAVPLYRLVYVQLVMIILMLILQQELLIEDSCNCGFKGGSPCNFGCLEHLNDVNGVCMPCGSQGQPLCSGKKPCATGYVVDQSKNQCTVSSFQALLA